MRRPMALVVLVALTLAGCAGRRPAGTDGDLTNNWSAMPAPAVVVPVVSSCYSFMGRPSAGRLSGDTDPVNCLVGQTVSEVAYVGTFTGADAAAAAPPVLAGAGRRAAFDRCQQAADEYLGGDWHSASLWLTLVLPDESAWRGGARWYRCDLVELPNVFILTVDHRIPLEGGLRGSGPLAIRCFTTHEDSGGHIHDVSLAGCDQPHTAEYAGTYIAPDGPWPKSVDEQKKLAGDGCEEVVARFLGFPDAAAWDNDAIGWLELGFDEDRWLVGDRSTRCFAYAYTKSKVMVGSVKGIRTRAPKSG